jgi:hypothetical protein
VSDRRYSTARWQKLRLLILARDGHICRIQGPRCRGVATTVNHIHPSSSHPHLFWVAENLQAACARCNYGAGSRIRSDNRRVTLELVRSKDEQIAYLMHVVEVQEERIGELEDEIARLRNSPKPANGRGPAPNSKRQSGVRRTSRYQPTERG